MEPTAPDNFHSFIFCRQGLQLTTVFHYDLTARPPGQSGLRAHRLLVEHLEGGRAGDGRAEPPMFPGQIMSVPQASRLMRAIPHAEQAHHVWAHDTGSAGPLQDLDRGRDQIRQLGLLYESLDIFSGRHSSGSSNVSPVNSPIRVQSRTTRVGRFSRPVIVHRSTSSHATVHVSSSTSLASHVSTTVRDGHTSNGEDHRPGSDSGEPARDVNTNAFVYSSASRLSIVSTRSDLSEGGDSDYVGRIRHDLTLSSSLTSVTSLNSMAQYGEYQDDAAGLSQADDTLPPSVEQDTSQIIQNWLAGMGQRKQVWDNGANTNPAGGDDDRTDRKRKADDCGGESCARLSEKPIAVVRPSVAAKRRRI